MIIVRVEGLKNNETQSKLEHVEERIKFAIADTMVLHLRQEDVLVFFSASLLEKKAGEKIIVIVNGIVDDRRGMDEVREKLAQKLANLVHDNFKETRVICQVVPCDIHAGIAISG